MCLLTLKSVYPSNVERKNVTLILRVFDEINVVALGMNNNFDSDSETILKKTTTDFIEIFIK